MGLMHEAVEDRVSQGRIADRLVPVLDWQLAGYDRRARAVPVIEDLEQIPAAFVGE